MIPFPQIDSFIHVLEHPSPDTELESSHSSPMSRAPFPHKRLTHHSLTTVYGAVHAVQTPLYAVTFSDRHSVH